MAKVYLAHDEVLDREVALKLLRDQYAGDEEFIERFRREAQSAARLSHPNIVSIYDRGRSEDGAYYIAMEYVPRGTLKDRMVRNGALAPGIAAGVAFQIADALEAAHEHGVIHRDIKPQNVLVTRTGDVKVTDFGIARAASSPLTQTSAVLGTAGYMSPEQAIGEPVGPPSDLYSLGVVLYEMLTGVLPYSAENPIALAMKHVNESPHSLREANPNVPEPLDALTLKLLAKNPEDRYASAAELADDLERVRSGLPPAAVGTEKTARMTAPVPPLPAAREGRTQRTAVRAPIAASPRVPGRGGRRWGGLSGALAALLFGVVLLAGIAWVLQNFLSEPDVSGGQSGASESEAPVAEEPATALVPDLVWASTAAADLGSVGLNLGTVAEVPSNTFLAGQVIETNPQEGTEAEVGSMVDITVSTGPAQVAPLPQPIPAPTPAPEPPAEEVPADLSFAPQGTVEDRKEAREDRKDAKVEAREEARDAREEQKEGDG
jgi:eukaryotic-like serine/threonine-protein kinase